jgi:tetratricopeptide (TPR) repeat protein/tRNA A-37 threonylcarbamoyl transferase component Bud32
VNAERETPATVTNADLSFQLSPGTLLSHRYRIVAPIGFGGMGVVYRARDEELGVDIAVKVLRPDLTRSGNSLERFRQELLLGREVSHKNVLRIHDIGEHEGLRFLTMRLVEGTSLERLLEREKALPLERALAILRQVAEGLAEAHESGIVHRDLKPGNILIEADGSATIADFGLARTLEGSGLTRAGLVVGTLDYLSPEQMAGEEVDARSDLYSLGIVLFEMLTAELPFEQGSPSEMVAQRLGGRPRDVESIGVRLPANVRRVLYGCLERRPARRYQSARALLADLDAPPRRTLPRWAWSVAAAIGLALGLAVLLRRGAVTPAPAPPRTAPPRAAAAEPARSVAVLPLKDETADPELKWAGPGLAEMLAANLAEEPRFRVVDPLRVFSGVTDLKLAPAGYDERTLRELGGLWSVDRLVTGTVRRSGRAVRVDLRLTVLDAGAAAPKTLSAESADAEGLFALVKELGRKLRGELGASAAPAPESEAPETTSLAAARAYEEGRRYLLAGNDVLAAPALEKAVAADPRFAAALERLSATYANLGQEEKALAAADRAQEALGSSATRLGYRVRARAALLKGSPEVAEKIYRELLARFPYDAETRVDLASAQAAEGHDADAVASLQKVVALDPGDGRAWFLLGKSSILAGDPARAAHDYLVHALAAQTRAGNEKGRADVLNAIGVASQHLGDNVHALESYGAALAARRALGDKRGTASTLRNRAAVYRTGGRSKEAEADLGEARRLLEELGDTKGLADVLNDFGVLKESRGEYKAALGAYEEALRARRRLGDERLLAQSYDNVGYIHFLEGAYDDAFVFWKQGLDLRRKTADKGGLVFSLQNLGFLWLAQGKTIDALKSFTEALQLARDVGNKEAVSVSLGNIGVLHREAGRYSAALDAFREALSVAKELGATLELTEFTLQEGETLLELYDLDGASLRVAAARAWVKETGNREHEADLERLDARVRAARGDKDAARAAFSRAARAATASGSRVAALRVEIASAAAGLEEPAAAAPRLEAALKQAKALGHAGLTRDAAEALARAELARGRNDAAERAAKAALSVSASSGFSAWRLHALLARALAARNDAAGAAREREAAAKELAAARETIPAALRASFARHPLVRESAGT